MTTPAVHDDLDAAFAAAGPDPVFDPKTLGPDWLPNGYHTITFPCGSHRTLRVHTERKGKFAGKRVVSLLIGPENSSDYEGIAFVSHTGVYVWGRHKNTKNHQYAQLLWELSRGDVIDRHSLISNKRCRICNRPLTEPNSANADIGPVCQERISKKFGVSGK